MSRSRILLELLLPAAICLLPVTVHGTAGDSNATLPGKARVELATGITMAYRAAGNPEGTPVLLLHGYTDTSRSFLPTMRAMLQRDPDLRIYAIDQRGHGDTSMPPASQCAALPVQCFQAADFAADVIAFMDALEIPRAAVVGHSMGSFVVQELALAYPERIRAIVMIGAAAAGKGNPVLQEFLLEATLEGTWKKALMRQEDFDWPADAYLLTPGEADPGALQWLSTNWVADPVADPAFLAAILPETAAIRLGTWIGALRAMLATDNRERLAELTVPALVIWARQDVVFPEQPEQAALRAALDAAVKTCKTRYVFKQYGVDGGSIGHNTQWAAPGAVAADIVDFLRIGKPVMDLPYTDAAGNMQRQAEKARVILKEPPAECRRG